MECSISDCSREAWSRGWCTMHYQRWRSTGDPMLVKPSRWHPVKTQCSIPDCKRPRWARDWCGTHYRRWQRYGDPLALRTPTPGSLTVEERFWAKVVKTSDCWVWSGSITEDGYGLFTTSRGRGMVAHRFAYQLHHGEISKEMELDHVCHNRDLNCKAGKECPHRRCVNPDHLDLVSNEEHRRTGWEDRRRRYSL